TVSVPESTYPGNQAIQVVARPTTPILPRQQERPNVPASRYVEPARVDLRSLLLPNRRLLFGLASAVAILSIATVYLGLRPARDGNAPTMVDAKHFTQEADSQRWTRSERENLAHFFRALRFNEMAFKAVKDRAERAPRRTRNKPMSPTDHDANVAAFEAAI